MNYTEDDYLNTDKPYKEIHDIKNPFERQQALKRAAAEAAKSGFKGFQKMYQLYEQSLKPSIVAAISNTADVSGYEDLDCGDWEVNEFGVSRNEEIACRIPVLITRRYENIDTGLEKVELSFKRAGRGFSRVIISCSQYASAKELVKLSDAGLPVSMDMAKSLSNYLTDFYSLNYEQIPCSASVGRLGWVSENKFSPFVDDLKFDGLAEYKAIFDSIRKKGKYDDWKAAAVSFRKESIAARIVLAASFASVLVKPLGTLPFFVHLWGVDSSTGKTVALLAAASVWANPEMGKYVKTFDGTDVGYERTAAFLNSLPMCIDELQLAKNTRGQVVFNVYRLSQGAGRIRGNKNGGVDVTPTWANAMITTGETPINSMGSGAGAVNRVIEIECTSAEKVVQDGHAAVQAFRKSYGYAGRDFVEHIMQPGAMDKAKRLYESAFAELNSNETTDKQAMAAALIVVSDQLATEWIFADGNALTAKEISRFLATRAAVSAGARGYEFMCDWVAQNANKFGPEVENGDIYGDFDGDWVYINSGVFRRAAEDAGYNQQALTSYMKTAGLIRVQAGRSTSLRRIKGTPTRCICMKLQSDDDAHEVEDDELL